MKWLDIAILLIFVAMLDLGFVLIGGVANIDYFVGKMLGGFILMVGCIVWNYILPKLSEQEKE